MKTDDFTHAVYDGDYLLHRYRWTKAEAKWYSNKNPSLKIVKLDKPKTESEYDRAYKLVGECLF